MKQKVLILTPILSLLLLAAQAQTGHFSEVGIDSLKVQSTTTRPMGVTLISLTSPANNQAIGYVGLHRMLYRTTTGTGNDLTDSVGIWIKGFYQGIGNSMPIFFGGKGYNSDESKMMIGGNGNVGIGTLSPQSKLAVNGDIFAKKVKVTQSGWPDYVFHEDYKLPSLQYVAAYIKEHNHLPDIPSAEEINKNGLDLGEMNKQLLTKIEELTLYLLEQNKKYTELKEQFELLETKMTEKRSK